MWTWCGIQLGGFFWKGDSLIWRDEGILGRLILIFNALVLLRGGTFLYMMCRVASVEAYECEGEYGGWISDQFTLDSPQRMWILE